MATQPESKIDAAAEKAYAEASARKTDGKKAGVSSAKVADAVEAEKPAPAKKAARKAAPKKTTAKKVAAKKAAPKAKPAAKATPKTAPKETIMTKAKATTEDYTAKVKEGLANIQERAKAAYDKGAEYAAEMNEFNKGNLEAIVESGKIYAAGVQEIAKGQFEDAKTAAETVTADVKEMAAVKSPTEFVQLQGKLASRNFDAAVAQVSKTTEAWVKLANDTFAPLSNRASVAIEKARKAA